MTSVHHKTSFIGFVACIMSVKNLYTTYVQAANSPLMKYLLTYKLSQDHIELFFGAIRVSCGSNYNPTVRQFTSAYKRLLMPHDVKGCNKDCYSSIIQEYSQTGCSWWKSWHASCKRVQPGVATTGDRGSRLCRCSQHCCPIYFCQILCRIHCWLCCENGEADPKM